MLTRSESLLTELPAPAPPNATPVREWRILIADSNQFSIRVLQRILGREGYLLSAVGSSKRLLALYPEFNPDLILLDAELPGDGFATCRELKRTYGAQCASIVFFTARTAAEDVVTGLEAGAADYLRKPFNSAEVKARIRAQLRNRQLVARQASLLVELQQANEQKNRLLGLVAQDLRVPLASLRQLSHFLRNGTLGPLVPDQQDLAETIHATSGAMLGLVNDLLDVAAIESGEIKLNREPTNLGLLIDRAVFSANMTAAQKDSRILFTAPITQNPVMVDAAKMRQVVDNLLSNAIKFSPPGSFITADMRIDSAGGFWFLVRDQGPGIPENERDKLFHDFGRLSAQPTAGEKSTGLGLSICRKIVLAHGGTIAAENLPGGGAEFRVDVPAPA